jgi:hypothetical protein
MEAWPACTLSAPAGLARGGSLNADFRSRETD